MLRGAFYQGSMVCPRGPGGAAGPAVSAAAAAGGEGAVEAVTDGETATFILPVSALDQELGFAAHSVRKDTWYDRSLTFHAESLQAK